MIRFYRRIRSNLRRSSTAWKVILFQALLLVAAVTMWAVLRSPSTITFFAFEVGVALAGGFFLSLRAGRRRARRRPSETTESPSPLANNLSSDDGYGVLHVGTVKVSSL